MKQFVSLWIILCTIASTGRAQTKIGYVDIDTITKKAKAVNSSFSKVGEKVNKLQSDIDSKTEKIKRLREDVQKSEGVLSREEVDKKRKEINDLLNEVEDLGMQGRRELQRVDDTFFTPLLKKIVYAIQDVANEKGLDLVLRGEAVLYGRDTVDITEDVVKKLNMEDLNSTATTSRSESKSKSKSDSTPKPSTAPADAAEDQATPAASTSDSNKAKATKAPSSTRPVDRQSD
jgi:Skp family chaperone for outer membrane proteins